MKQILLTLLSFLFSSHQGKDQQIDLLATIKQTVRDEVSAVIFKTLIGLVLAGAAIFSFIQFGKALEVLFAQYENGVTFQLITFVAATAVCCALLYFLFKKPKQPVVEPSLQQPHIEGIFAQFTEGLMQGLEKGKTQESAQAADIN